MKVLKPPVSTCKNELSQKLLIPISWTWKWCWSKVRVCVWLGVWYTCVHICIIYISNIYYIYLYHISVEGCHGDQSQYICNSFHHPNLSFLCIHTRFSCKPSEVTCRMGERVEEGKNGKQSDFNEIKRMYHQLATFGLYAKLWKIRWVDEELPATNWKVFCESVLCLVQKMTIYQLSPYLELVQLWKVTVNALLVLSSLVTWLRNLHHRV